MVKSEKSIGVKESNNISYKLTIVLWICQISTWTCILSFILYNTLPEYKIVINCHEDREGDIVCNHTSLGKFCFFFLYFWNFFPFALLYLGIYIRNGRIFRSI